MAFLHGSETKEIEVAGRAIQVVLTSVVGFVGIAPKGPAQTLTLVTSPAQAVEIFGNEVPGFSLPEALAAHFAEGGGVVLVVNTYDAAENTAAVAAEVVTVEAGRVVLDFAPVSAVTLTTADAATTLVLGTDYRVNAYGVVTILNREDYPDATDLKASYTKLAPASVTSAQIVGGIDSATSLRTGLSLFELAYSTFGFNAKILAAPGYSVFASVASALQVLAKKYRAVALVDAPKGTTPAAAIAGRGVVAPLGGMGTNEPRAYILYPHLYRPDPATPATELNRDPQKLVPYSAVMAGVISATDNNPNFGYWFSPSNKKMVGVTGLEIKLSAAINDSTTDVQLLNAAGITTVFAGFGSGFRTWGNRSGVFPIETGISSFLSVRRTADVIEETIELAFLPFADLPLSPAGVDTVRNAVIAFLAVLKGRGAIIDGTCEFLPEDNPIAQLSAGNPVFTYTFLPPPPMERATFKAKLDASMLKQLFAK